MRVSNWITWQWITSLFPFLPVSVSEWHPFVIQCLWPPAAVQFRVPASRLNLASPTFQCGLYETFRKIRFGSFITWTIWYFFLLWWFICYSGSIPYSNRATVWTIQEFESLKLQAIFMPKHPDGPWGPHIFVFSWYVFSSVLKWPGRDNDHSSACSADIKNEWCLNSTPLHVITAWAVRKFEYKTDHLLKTQQWRAMKSIATLNLSKSLKVRNHLKSLGVMWNLI